MSDETIYFSDLKWLFRLKKKTVFCGMLVGGIFFLLFTLFSETRYEVRALFKEGVARQGATSANLFQNLMQSMQMGDSQTKSPTIMRSYRISTDVVETLGLQISQPKTRLSRVLRRGKETLYTAAGKKISDPDPPRFAHVSYELEDPSLYYLRLKPHTFELLDSKKKVLAMGKVGIPIVTDNFTFTLTHLPVRTKKLIPIKVIPKHIAIQRLQKPLRFKPKKENANLIELIYQHRDRQLAITILNELMEAYKRYLHYENSHLASSQLSYLNERMQDLFQKMDAGLTKYRNFLLENLGEGDFLTLNQEMLRFSKRQEEYKKHLFALEANISELHRVKKRETVLFGDPNVGKEMQEMQFELNRLKKREQSINHKEVQQNRLDIDYHEKHHGLESEIQQLELILKRIHEKNFELSSLNAILKDSMSQKLVSEMGVLMQKMRDETNLSDKERQRMEKDIERGRISLTKHITQVIDLKKLQDDLICNKISQFQQTSLDLTKQDIGTLETQIEGFIQNHLENLNEKKKILQEKLEQLKRDMRHLPDRWLHENKLQFRSDLDMGMIEGMIKLIESKNIEAHLMQIESKPLDRAYAPLKPKPPFLIVFSCLGFFMGGIATFGFQVLKASNRGFPISPEHLRALHIPVIHKMRHLLYQLTGKVILLTQPKEAKELASLLGHQGKKVLLVHAHFSDISMKGDLPGLYYHLQHPSEALPIQSYPYYDEVCMGAGDPMHFPYQQFQAFITKTKEVYDHLLVASENHNYLNLSDINVVILINQSLDALQPYLAQEGKSLIISNRM